MNMLKDLWATELALRNNKKSFINHEWLLIGNSVKVNVQFFSLDFGNHPVITSNITVYTCWFCLKNLSLSDDSVFIGVSDKLQTDHMTCWVMQRTALPSPGCVSVYNWSALCLLCFLRSPMTVSRGLRLGGPPPLEWSAALVGTLWFLYYPLFLPPIPSCPSPPLPPLPPPSSPLPSRRCAGRHEHSNRAGSHHTWNVLLRYGCWIRVRLLLFSSNRVVYILYT